MTTPDMPQQLNISRHSTSDGTTVAAADPSPNGTIFYSLDEQDASLKRQDRHDGNEEEPTVAIKQQKTFHDNDNDRTMPTTPTTPNPVSKPLLPNASSINDFTVVENTPFELETPDWSANSKAWAFLQSQNPKYPNKYLVKKESDGNERAGYLLGRNSDSDIRFERNEISKKHCLIYMETGSNGKAKGIRIFLEDYSFNGTYVNGILVGCKNRVMLRNKDEIQLFRRKSYPETDLRNRFYRVLFPPVFEANLCEHEYEFQQTLGRGNFASVKRATHRVTGKTVAIKVLNKNRFAQKPKMIQAIIQEVSIMMSLRKHPLVVNIDRVFNEQHTIYLVLEYVPGGELFDFVSSNKTIDEDKTRFIFWQLFTGLKYLHDNNIAHRDLKPENVLLADRDTLQVKITDFGLAKTEQRDQSFGSQCGTPNYVAPEILNSSDSRAYDKKCDLWSLGVMLYICLCGYPPFSEENAPPSMKAQIKMGKYDFPDRYWGHISELAKGLIKELLTVDPSKRISIEEAQGHEWMYLNPTDMEARKARLGEQVLANIQDLETKEDMTPTQIMMTQSQSVEYY
ncbi:uncharacterized protein ATC70_003433 [Mucor velutinosus]|uniref:Pkinase-domain-containing protein n=1 Tax=Mucor velutinosus TaxID=708070 RepID=A0AAN7D976_9FUNG|nr:hypothetical protein ATC70_003433 [Mucor velutinosus]